MLEAPEIGVEVQVLIMKLVFAPHILDEITKGHISTVVPMIAVIGRLRFLLWLKHGIILSPQRLVREYLVSLVNGLKLYHGSLAVLLPFVRIKIRMVLLSQIEKCFPNILFGLTFGDTKSLVIILTLVDLEGLRREGPSSIFYHY